MFNANFDNKELNETWQGIPAKKWRDQPKLAEHRTSAKVSSEDEEKSNEHVQMEKSC